MKKDFKEVLKMFKDDLARELGDPVAEPDEEETEEGEKGDKDEEKKDEFAKEDKKASLAHGSADVHAVKQSVIQKTKQFAEAMKSLESSSKTAMKKDFKEVLKMFKDD